MFSGKSGYPGINVQIATDLDGNVIAVGSEPVHGARHDAHAYAASSLAATLATIHTAADLGYVGVDGIDITPVRKPPRAERHPHDARFQHVPLASAGTRRTRGRPPQDLADAQRGRRPIPPTPRKVCWGTKSRRRLVLPREGQPE